MVRVLAGLSMVCELLGKILGGGLSIKFLIKDVL